MVKRAVWLLCGVSLMGAAAPLPPEQLEQELTSLEQGPPLFGSLHRRTHALSADLSHYPPAAQARIRRLDCYNQSADRIELMQAAVREANRLIELARQEQDAVAVADLTICRGGYYQLLGDVEAARRDFDAALHEAQRLHAIREEGLALAKRGDMLSYIGRLGEGIKDQQQAYRLLHQAGAIGHARIVQLAMARTYRRMEYYSEALSHLNRIHARLVQQERHDELARLQLEYALLHLDSGRYQMAIDSFIAARHAFGEGDSVQDIDLIRIGEAEARLGLRQPELAQALLQESAPRMNRQSDPSLYAYWELIQAKMLTALGQAQQALPLLEQAELFFAHEENQRFLMWIQRARSEAMASLQRYEEAYAALQLYLALEHRIDEQLLEQQQIWMRNEFTLAREQAKHDRLKAAHALQQQKLERLVEVRFWRNLVYALGLVLALLTVAWLAAHSRQLRALAFTDELTGIKNRRRIMARGAGMLSKARRQQQPFSVLLFDIDRFKRINDSFGHHQGDRVLQWVVKCVRCLLRHDDALGRTGGEEFLVLLPHTNLTEADRVARRICQFVAARVFPNMPAPVTISIGVAQLKEEDGDLNALIQRADAALYRAKENGRNRVERAD